MLYLHDSPLQCHGTLRSSNILIDSRWTCKVADFGLTGFREGERPVSYGDHAYYYSQSLALIVLVLFVSFYPPPLVYLWTFQSKS